jgi:hypothetical protein
MHCQASGPGAQIAKSVLLQINKNIFKLNICEVVLSITYRTNCSSASAGYDAYGYGAGSTVRTNNPSPGTQSRRGRADHTTLYDRKTSLPSDWQSQQNSSYRGSHFDPIQQASTSWLNYQMAYTSSEVSGFKRGYGSEGGMLSQSTLVPVSQTYAMLIKEHSQYARQTHQPPQCPQYAPEGESHLQSIAQERAASHFAPSTHGNTAASAMNQGTLVSVSQIYAAMTQENSAYASQTHQPPQCPQYAPEGESHFQSISVVDTLKTSQEHLRSQTQVEPSEDGTGYSKIATFQSKYENLKEDGLSVIAKPKINFRVDANQLQPVSLQCRNFSFNQVYTAESHHIDGDFGGACAGYCAEWAYQKERNPDISSTQLYGALRSEQGFKSAVRAQNLYQDSFAKSVSFWRRQLGDDKDSIGTTKMNKKYHFYNDGPRQYFCQNDGEKKENFVDRAMSQISARPGKSYINLLHDEGGHRTALDVDLYLQSFALFDPNYGEFEGDLSKLSAVMADVSNQYELDRICIMPIKYNESKSKKFWR